MPKVQFTDLKTGEDYVETLFDDSHIFKYGKFENLESILKTRTLRYSPINE